MDPITLAAGAILGTAAALGAPAGALGAAAAAGPAAVVGATFGVPAAVGSAAGGSAVAGPVASDPHARLGVQNGLNDAYNQGAAAATDLHNQAADQWNDVAVPQLNAAGVPAGPVPHANFGG